MAIDVAPFAGINQVKLEKGGKPVLRRPGINVVLFAVEACRDAGVNRLALVVVCDDEGVDEGRQDEQKTEDIGDQPGVVEGDGDFARVWSRGEPENEEAANADEDESRPRRAIAGVPLIHDEVFGFAFQIVRRAVECEFKGAAGGGMQPSNHCRDEGQLDDGDDHQQRQRGVEGDARIHFDVEKKDEKSRFFPDSGLVWEICF